MATFRELNIICFFCLLSTQFLAQIDTILLCDAGNSIQLQARKGQFAYQWTPSNTLSNPTIDDPIATPSETTTYIAKMIPALIGENLISNPDFSEGNVGFTSDYPFVESINTQGVYGVSKSAKELNNVFFTDCPDHTSGDGLMMVVDGSPVANEKVWCQTIEIQPNRSYAFSAWLTSVKVENPAELQFSINGTRIGRTFIAANQVCEWRQFFEVWDAGEATEAEICIVNRNTNPQGNDFALDDFAFYEIEDIIYDTTVVLITDLAIDTMMITQIPDCGMDNGKIEIAVKGGVGDLTYALDNSPFQTANTFQNIQAGEFEITIQDEYITAISSATCAIQSQIKVNQKNCPIYLPNIFSPNNDGKNDLFLLQSHPDFRGQITSFSIFDRWGNLIFTSQNQAVADASWDGTFKGKEVVEGLYVCLVKVAYEDGNQILLMGELNVVR
ncbi:MAG: gliding motility-associated C-terminal domain-containing protein [Bacteroidota bacterium]